MAKYLDRNRLTETEIETLNTLEANGIEVYPAPIRITSKEQLKSLGITYEHCVTWRIGSEKVIVHPTPAPKEVYDILLGELRSEHCNEYLKKRCKVPGTKKPLIICPASNRCAECPYPEYRNQHQADNLSYEEMIEKGYEEVYSDHAVHEFMILDELDEALTAIKKVNPKYALAVYLRYYLDLSIKETADRMCISERMVTYYVSEAVKIGKKFRKQYEQE